MAVVLPEVLDDLSEKFELAINVLPKVTFDRDDGKISKLSDVSIALVGDDNTLDEKPVELSSRVDETDGIAAEDAVKLLGTNPDDPETGPGGPKLPGRGSRGEYAAALDVVNVASEENSVEITSVDKVFRSAGVGNNDNGEDEKE